MIVKGGKYGVGKRFGRWTVIGHIDCRHRRCECDCGVKATLTTEGLRAGGVPDCAACLRLENDTDVFVMAGTARDGCRLAAVEYRGLADVAATIVCSCGHARLILVDSARQLESRESWMCHSCRICRGPRMAGIKYPVSTGWLAKRAGVTRQCIHKRIRKYGYERVRAAVLAGERLESLECVPT